MRHPRIKLIVSVVILLALTAALGAAFFRLGVYSDDRQFKSEITQKLAALREMYTTLVETRVNANEVYSERNAANARLMATMLMPIVHAEGDAAIRDYEFGCVVKKTGDALTFPEDSAYADTFKAGLFTDDQGVVRFEGSFGVITGRFNEIESKLFYFCRVLGDYYYVDDATTEINEITDVMNDIEAVLREVEQAFGSSVLMFVKQDDDWQMYYAPKALGAYSTANELGIDMGAGEDVIQTLVIDGKEYCCAVSNDVSTGDSSSAACLAYLTPAPTWTSAQRGGIVLVLGIAFLLMTALTAWVIAVVFLLRHPNVSAEDRARYTPRLARRVALGIGVVGVAVVAAVTMLVHSMIGLIATTENVGNILEALNDMLEQDQKWIEHRRSRTGEQYTGYALRAADLLDSHPNLQTPEALQKMCDIIGANYLMLYDSSGNETVTNAPYIHLSFGTDETSSTYDFRRLLLGVPSIVHDCLVDEQTGLDSQLIGARMGRVGDSDGYGALILSMPSDGSWNKRNTDAIIRSLSSADSVCFGMDGDTGVIAYASDPEIVGRNALTLGLQETQYQDGEMDFFRFNGEGWYGRARGIDGLFFLYLTKDNAIFAGCTKQGTIFGGLFLAAYAVLAALLLMDFNEKSIRARAGGQAPEEAALFIRHRSDWNSSGNVRAWWREKTPGWKTVFVVQILFVVELVCSLIAMRLGFDFGDSGYLFAYLFSGNWQAGFNLFSFIKIAILIVGVVLTIMALNVISGIVRATMETRGKTICLIVFNMIEYAVVGMGVYYAFLYVGIDITVPLASLAAVSFAITLLAKDTISDILAGVATAFTNSYRIGDYVEVNGFRGRVQDITMSTTTLVNNDGHVKVFNNRDVHNVLNMSRGGSRYTVDITIGYDQSLEAVEALLSEELPNIGKRIPEVRGTPRYIGVTRLGSGGMTLTIAARCKERDYATVRHRMNVELGRLFQAHSIRIM